MVETWNLLFGLIFTWIIQLWTQFIVQSNPRPQHDVVNSPGIKTPKLLPYTLSLWNFFLQVYGNVCSHVLIFLENKVIY